MTPHSATGHPGQHAHPEQHDDDGPAELLELEAEILGPLPDEVVDRVAQHNNRRTTPRGHGPWTAFPCTTSSSSEAAPPA